MPKPLIIALLAYDGFQLLDVTGPAAVFAAANHERKRNVYRVEVLSPAGGAVASDSGVTLQTRAMARMPAGRIDTVLIAGAEANALRAVIADPAVRRWVPRRAAKARLSCPSETRGLMIRQSFPRPAHAPTRVTRQARMRQATTRPACAVRHNARRTVPAAPSV